MKRFLALLLALALVLSLTACGAAEPVTTEVATNENTILAPEADPTESMKPAEAVLQLSEALQQVYNLGIADIDLLLRAEAVCTRAEAIGMLAKVHEMQYGQKSVYLHDMVDAFEIEEWSSPVTRFYFAQAVFCSAMETVLDFPYENWYVWACECTGSHEVSWPDASIVAIRLDGTPGESSVWESCPDLQEIETAPSGNSNARHMIDYGSTPAAAYVTWLYDRRDGNKVMELDENYYFRPYETMTIEQAAETALRYYYSFEPNAEMVAYADTYTFDTSIITPELLAKETTLPDASCEKLPSQWRGTLIYNGRVIHQAMDRMPDKHYYEYMIQAVQDAGFNFVGITFDFSRLQGPELQVGMLNETRLKELDQVIAWCMERDIHVDLRCCGLGGLSYDAGDYWYQWNHDAPNGTEYAEEFAALWKALAQRYADIPNRYLSFNLLIEAEVNSEQQYVAFFGPAVNAIREADPDRCIIADIHCGGLTGKSMGEMGVALSYHTYDPREFCCLTLENQDDAEYLSNVTWPFTASDGKSYDAATVLDNRIPGSISANELAATAEEYGVGFMVGEWGIFGDGLTRNRYPDETIEAFLKDMAGTLEEKGYGWCYGNFHYPYSIACFAPAVKTGDYVKIEGTPLYVEQKMMGWFQEINGVK